MPTQTAGIPRRGTPAVYYGIDVVVAAVIALGEATVDEVAGRLGTETAVITPAWDEAQQLRLISPTDRCTVSGLQRFALVTRAALATAGPVAITWRTGSRLTD